MNSQDPIIGEKGLRAVILGAGRETPCEDGRIPLPRCLLTDPFGRRVLDWILSAFESVGITKITFVGGYRIELIGSRYPSLKYIYNEDWEQSGVLESLSRACEEFDGPTLVSYADVVYHQEACRKLVESAGDSVTIAVDTTWRDRNVVDALGTEVRKNLVILGDGKVRDIGFLVPSYAVDAEFVGLVHFGDGIIDKVKSFLKDEFPRLEGQPFAQAEDARLGYLTDLLRHFLSMGIEIKAVDIGASWAEMDGLDQMARFVLGTKGETLERLASLVKQGRFCKQQVYEIREWYDDKDAVLASAKETFGHNPIVVRSSTLLEDSWDASHAGAFKSVLDVDPTDLSAVAGAIEEVLASYGKGSEEVQNTNQFLIQEMVQDVVMSGVVFTRDIDTGAPYYVINYDDTGTRTDTVTSGASNDLKTVLISRSCDRQIADQRIGRLLKVVKELESVTGCTALDIEFAIDAKEDVYVLQARPLALIDKEDRLAEVTAEKELSSIRAFLTQRLKRIPYLFGETTVLADMPDWNPAEMIGTRPRQLASSMYHYLIMNSAWRTARARIGYHHPEPAALMVLLGNHPYVDVRSSFNNLIPAALDDNLKEKLVNHYIERLRRNPDMHDKVEFEICFTCLDFEFDRTATRLSDAGFAAEEIAQLKHALRSLTDNIVTGTTEPAAKLLAELSALDERRAAALDACSSPDEIPLVIGQLLDDCIALGTVPFSILARYAFIAYSLLRSLRSMAIITEDEEQAVLQSIETVATDMARDMNNVKSGAMPREQFLEVYGHLRPGTYDITSPRYDEAPDDYFPLDASVGAGDAEDETNDGVQMPTFDDLTLRRIQAAIKEMGFSFDVPCLFAFIEESISLRERAKFEFTRTVSSVLHLIHKLGSEYDYSREDLSYLNIEQVRLWGLNAFGESIEERLADEIDRGKKRFKDAEIIKLPHIITSLADVDIMSLEVSRPNFVTLKKVNAEVVSVSKTTDPKQLEGRIALIEGADPGFDWIFLHQIAGLITKYGGAASHMTIRAAEFGIPAAIGCGDILYDRIAKAHRVELDCIGKNLHVL